MIRFWTQTSKRSFTSSIWKGDNLLIITVIFCISYTLRFLFFVWNLTIIWQYFFSRDLYINWKFELTVPFQKFLLNGFNAFLRGRMTSWHRNIFHITGPMWGESTGDRWIALTMGQQSGALMYEVLLTWVSFSMNSRVAAIWDTLTPMWCHC